MNDDVLANSNSVKSKIALDNSESARESRSETVRSATTEQDAVSVLRESFSGQCPDGNPPSGKSISAKPRKAIFFGNGMLADFTLPILRNHFDIIFHARTRDDLARVIELKQQFPEAHGVLASFGVLIKSDVLEAFEPEGILNLHPSLLPKYRGASPIESAILAGDTVFGYSIMKLVKSMDAGPIYHQATLENLPIDKTAIYQALATAGSEWLSENIEHLPESITQNDTEATFCGKLDKSMSFLEPNKYPAKEIFRQIVAYQGFPKPKYEFYGKTCIILEAHVLRVTDILCEAAGINTESSPLMLKCADRNFVVIDRLQPEGKKPMDAKSFLNGYKR